MDGVICDFTHPCLRKVNKLYNLELKMEDVTIPSFAELVKEGVKEKFGKEAAAKLKKEEIYKEVCGEGYFKSLRAFPGAVEAVKELYHEGFEIVIVTKPLEWRYSSAEKMAWLKKRFSDIEYSVIMVHKTSDKHRVMVDFLIDDDPRCLGGEYSTGICIEHTWNKEYLETHPDMVSVPSLKDAATHIIKLKDYFFKEELNFLGF